ncbi:ATP-binding protein [Streptomyces sp. KMM 9044]|uniref:ATP-binding protein n=1 Tax=Streptomyces sp. KMM 9044 TaxID=2744474 RepID=UPI002151C399|nr:ATP-binding protein [Streptomyces sp. KMM 9044]WAX79676.1 ATP-binding protein [Streptomyces sp. KMM 9044]
MSTTRPHLPGDRGPEPGGASGVPGGSAPTASAADGGVASPPSAAQSTVASVPEASGLSGSSGGGRKVRRLSFEDQSGVVPLARDFTRQALHAWGWLPAADRRAAAEDVLLVVSELVTNACLHAEGPDRLSIACDNKVIRLEVTDRGTGQPAPRTPHQAGRPGGHGMFIVQRLCLDWGVLRTPGVAGKTVWAELGAPA